ncbi:MAG: NAD-binding protein, partial [Nitriliruptorales bacterium]|nr:NAD-binding protein [Nitriliruptorales bacterium]
ADRPAEVAGRCPVVILSLPGGQISRSVCLDAGGVLEGARRDTILLETSTVLPEDAETLGAELAAGGIGFCDAALSASSDMVARGETLAMVGGDPGTLSRVEPVLRAFCREVRHVGGHGDGMRAKLVVNYVLAMNRFAMAEGLVLAEKMALDLEQMLAVLRSSAAFSTAMNMWGQRMIDHRYTEPISRIRMHNKDAELMLELGRRHGAPLFGMAQLNTLVQVALANGWGESDNSVIIEVLRRAAGIAGEVPDVTARRSREPWRAPRSPPPAAPGGPDTREAG